MIFLIIIIIIIIIIISSSEHGIDKRAGGQAKNNSKLLQGEI